jgi:hypothetical protein
MLNALFLVFSTAAALAVSQNGDEQKCLNAVNKATAKVAQKQGKENAACVKAGNKGTATAGCLTLDPKTKVSKAKDKTLADEMKKCIDTPGFGYTNGAIGNAAAQDEEVSLFVDVYGVTDPTAVISSAKLEGGCQFKTTKGLEKLIAAKWKQFLACKKAALKAGADDIGDLEACLSGDPNSIAADPKSKIAKKKMKLDEDIGKNCAGVDVATTFPGDCSGASLAGLADCLDEQASCRVCRALNTIDAMAVDCDAFDASITNSSCENPPPPATSTPTNTPTPTPTVTPTGTPTPPGPDWGLACFSTADCGSFCAGTGCQCDAFLGSVGVPPGSAMCFFDCMDAPGTVTSCRAACGGPGSAPACETGTAGSGGFPGVVTGPGKCTPSGFGASVSFGGTAGELKRVVVSFATAIDESTLFDGPVPACPVGCPATCPPPISAVAPLPDVFRWHIGAASPAPEVCDRLGVATHVCKSDPTTYVIVLDSPICTPVPIDLSLFISCHVSDGGGSFLHFSTGDFFAVGSWPP